MKKEKMVEVAICDFCKQEKETRPCAGCHGDACVDCSTRIDVFVTHWQTTERYYSGTMTMGFPGNPSFSGIFCSQCSPEAALTNVGFIKREKAA